MRVTGMLHGARLLRHVGFPVPEILGPDASEASIQALIARHETIFVKPVFKGGVGKSWCAPTPSAPKSSTPLPLGFTLLPIGGKLRERLTLA